ncbi:MAG: 8-amino-7-oxononanoate synthase [Planctomycetota bacterium]
MKSSAIEGVFVKQPDGERLVNFGSNDYLGLASKPLQPGCRLGRSSEWSDHDHQTKGVSATASSLICGWTDRHELLAQQLADFKGSERVLVFPSGFAACGGVIATLATKDDLVASDELNHASLIDGCRLSKADRLIYPHRDVSTLRQGLQQRLATGPGRYRRIWIVTDSVFSMDGHLAPLPDLCEVAEEFGADLIIDEAHATGILGKGLSGACEAFGLKDRIAIRIGTLSKAFGAQGGFVACPNVIAEYLINRCRSFIYSTALSLPCVEAVLSAMQSIEDLARRRDAVCRHARRLRSSLGITAMTPSDLMTMEAHIPIVPIMIGDDRSAVAAAMQLRQRGFFVPAIRPPTVPAGLARLRVSLSASHSDEMVSRLIEGLRAI